MKSHFLRRVTALVLLTTAFACQRNPAGSGSHLLSGTLLLQPAKYDFHCLSSSRLVDGEGRIFVDNGHGTILGVTAPFGMAARTQSGDCAARFSVQLEPSDEYRLIMQGKSHPDLSSVGPTYSSSDLEQAHYQISADWIKDFAKSLSAVSAPPSLPPWPTQTQAALSGSGSGG